MHISLKYAINTDINCYKKNKISNENNELDTVRFGRIGELALAQQILRRFQESFETETGSYDGVQLSAQAGASGAGASGAGARGAGQCGAVRTSARRGAKPQGA